MDRVPASGGLTTGDRGSRVDSRLCENIDDDRREKTDKHDHEADDRQVDRATVILLHLARYLQRSIQRAHLESHAASIKKQWNGPDRLPYPRPVAPFAQDRD